MPNCHIATVFLRQCFPPWYLEEYLRLTVTSLVMPAQLVAECLLEPYIESLSLPAHSH